MAQCLGQGQRGGSQREGGRAPAQSGTPDRAAPPSATAKPTGHDLHCNIIVTCFVLALRLASISMLNFFPIF